MPSMPNISSNRRSPSVFVLYDGFGISVKPSELVSQLCLHQVSIFSVNTQYSAYHRKLSDMMIKGLVIWYGLGMKQPLKAYF
jgi:hypothetical protein